MNHEEIAKNLSDGIDAALFEQYGAEWKRRAEQAERDRDTLATEVTAWRDVYTSHELRAVQAERDRAVLAAEVEAWRRAFDEQTGRQIGDSSDCRDVSAARVASDAGALTRAK